MKVRALFALRTLTKAVVLKPHWREDKTEKVTEGTLASHYPSFFHIGRFIYVVVRS